MYISSNSQFKSNMMHSTVGKQDMWESVQKKKNLDQTINSEEPSVESQIVVQQQQSYQLSQESQIINQPSNQQQGVEYQEEFVLNTQEVQEDKQINYQEPQIFTQNQGRASILQYNKPKQLQPFKPEKTNKSVSMASYYTSSYRAKKTQMKVVYAFHYDRIGDQVSKLFQEEIKNPVSFLWMEFIIPWLVVFVSQIIILIAQNSIGQYCFIDSIQCENYWFRVWSFTRQMILYKLGLIFAKGHIIYQLTTGNRLLKMKHRRPLMEYFLLIFLTIATDFIMTFWIGLNEDWIFLIYLYIIGIVVFFNTFRMKNWPINIKKGFSYFAYEIAIIGLLLYCFYVLPSIRNSLHKYNQVAAPEYYMFIYPFLDLVMEIYIDLILSLTKHSELLIYQAQLLIIGTRAGTLIIGEMTRFDYWFCLFFLIIFRFNNASMAFTVFLRRSIYYGMPETLRPLFSMEETSLTLKGKHGAYYEHQIWIFYFYLFCISGKTVAYYAADKILVSNGEFDTSIFEQFERWKFQTIGVWLFLIIPEVIGFWINRQKCYDNIKMLGGCKLRFYENVFIRMIGFYLFNFALLSCLI